MKKSVALLAVLTLTGCYIPSETYEIEAPVAPVSRNKPDVECTAEELHGSDWYADMCSQLMEFKTTCIVDDRVKNRDVEKALSQLSTDYPEIFWTGKTYYAATVTDGSEISLGRPEWFEWDDVPVMYDELVSAGDELIAGIPDGSDYEKILYVHDYIIEHTVYDKEAAEADSTKLAGTSYGCLVQGSAVCEGYAEAFQYIMNRIGIECGICTGSNHAWNYVNVNGEYYWIDLTWDDNENTPPQHTFFLFNEEMLLRTRNFDVLQGNLPECDSLADNYFVVNGGYFTEYDEEAVLSYIADKVQDGRCEIMFADFESYKTALYALFSDAVIRKADGVGHSSLTYYRYDDMFSVDIIF
ncbi:MAG: hypothetical protein NC340_02445 [Ruminococcus flavefaciens]|nr:hypothetical protein [Ruminococcus flavefaciens]MCM1229333.1 hypothetical protein [Ruminococcus flavefaciens]